MKASLPAAQISNTFCQMRVSAFRGTLSCLSTNVVVCVCVSIGQPHKCLKVKDRERKKKREKNEKEERRA